MLALDRFRARFETMPRLLQLVATASVVLGLAFTVLPFIPAAVFNLDGRPLSHTELWDTRVAFALLVAGPLMLVVGSALLAGRRWVRPLLLVLPLLQTLPFFIVQRWFGAPSPVGDRSAWIVWIVGSSLWALAAAAYLYGARGPKQYFA
jgi:hypothetical protein